MPYNTCTVCGQILYIKPVSIKKGWGKFCSKKCQYLGQRKGSDKKCSNCGKSIYRSLASEKKSKSKIFFCDKKCSCAWKNKMKVEKNHSNWVSGESSYRKILTRSGRSKMCESCKLTDERVLIVHHIDCNRKNNTLENLKWLCFNCHVIEHKEKK